MSRYGIVNGLNLYVVVAEDESAAARQFMDQKPYLVAPPNLPRRRRGGKCTMPEYRDYPLLVGEVFDLDIFHYGGSRLLCGDNAIAKVFCKILRRESEGVRRFIIRINETSKSEKWIKTDTEYAAHFFDRMVGHIERVIAACSEEDECGCGCDIRCLVDMPSDCICRACAVCGLCECCYDENHAYTGCLNGEQRRLKRHGSGNMDLMTRCVDCNRSVKAVYTLRSICAECFLKPVRSAIY